MSRRGLSISARREKQATTLDLLRGRSGVYHDPARETAGMRAQRPVRGSHPPGSFFDYSNWDFNVLRAIFQQLTHSNIFQDIDQRIAKPLGMNDYVPAGRGDRYLKISELHLRHDGTEYGSLRLLCLRQGKWESKQVVPAAWVSRSTTSYSDLDTFSAISNQTGYGFLWSTETWGYSAIGASGHMFAVIPEKDMVVVHRVAYDPPLEDVVPYSDIDSLIRI